MNLHLVVPHQFKEIYQLNLKIILEEVNRLYFVIFFLFQICMHKRMSPHGDYDHMGEAINLVNNFKVDKTILNFGVL